jgi:hypothetical protein
MGSFTGKLQHALHHLHALYRVRVRDDFRERECRTVGVMRVAESSSIFMTLHPIHSTLFCNSAGRKREEHGKYRK